MMQEDTTKIEDIRIPEELPILSSKESIVYPSMILPLLVEGENLIKLINDAVVGRRIIGLFAVRQAEDHARLENLYDMGTVATIARMLKMPDGSVQVLLQGIARIRLRQIVQTEPYLRGRVEVFRDQVVESLELQAMVRNIISQFQKVVSLSPHLPQELAIALINIAEPGKLADFIGANINLSLPERQEILETIDVGERLTKLTTYINREMEILEIGSNIQSRIKGEMDKAQREYYLREQLKAIQKELGETDERSTEIEELKEKIKAAGLPPEAQKEAERELDRLARMPPAAAEYTVARTYLDWMINLPWNKTTSDNLDIALARRVLDEDHYDLEKVKERILEYLAVGKLRQDMKGPILCFVGPAGVGKTSLGQSIARALGRKFVRISLGGMRDEAEIRGHRRTYVGALPGRIIQEIRRAESRNPVFMLDEIDKIGADFRGDPAAALLEVLDPQQNFSFADHYLDVPFDLSKVMFITTANVLYTIPPALRDRMEVLELPGYTEYEKLEIARRYLIPRQLREHGLSDERLYIADEALAEVIRSYTREAGVRNLEREIASLCRKVARMVAEGRTEKVYVSADDLHEFLGPLRFRYELAGEGGEVGMATGLAWTEMGGEVLFVEATLVPGKGGMILTGKLGDVMQESAKAAITYARSRAAALGVAENFYEKYDIHIHLPSGAIPKDGPSAGITMATALVSALTKRPVKGEVAMTGEITLRGRVLPVGGIKEKVLAAHRAGIKTVILPKDNEKDLEEVPSQVRSQIQFIPVEHVDQVLREALQAYTKEEKVESLAAAG